MNILSSSIKAPKYANQIIDSKKSDIIIVENFIPKELVDYVKKLTNAGSLQPSKRGKRVNIEAKIRDDYFFKYEECSPLDAILLPAIINITREYYGCQIAFREAWKVGNYLGSKKGFYIPHTDTAGGFNHRIISCVTMLSDPNDYEGGELVFPKYGQKIKLRKYSAAIFPSGILHGVNPTLSGKRQTLLSFMWSTINMQLTPKLPTKYVPRSKLDFEHTKNSYNCQIINKKGKSELIDLKITNAIESGITNRQKRSSEFGLTSNQNYLLYLPLKGGFGNQVQSLKQSLIIGKILNRKVITCPFFPHYTQKHDIKLDNLIAFDYLFEYTNSNDIEIVDIPTYLELCKNTKNVINMLKGYIEVPSLPEMIINSNFSETIIKKRRFSKPSQVLKSLQYDEHILAIKSPFTCIKLHDCGIYDCVSCLNKENEFSEINQYINSNLGFSKSIKDIASTFAKENLPSKYLSIHIRFPDTKKDSYPQKFKECYGIDIGKLEPLVIEFISNYNLEAKVFVATNSIKHAKELFSQIHPVFYNENGKVYDSFIEQAICVKSEIFLGCSVNRFSVGDDTIHRRSTWSSMVNKMRLNKVDNTISVYWSEILSK